jgi:hypothetical protein
MVRDPAFNAEVVKLAMPPPRLPVPSTVDPFLNVTISPSGGGPLTVAVKVTACVYAEGFWLELTVVVVGGFFTLWITEPELERKFPSPP